MLEIRNLTKIYKTKGGVDVKALDNVSINFEETGLVFLLGKSGSGKSTLLNLAGGLDEPTSGEVIVMGKSSKDFSGGDFDSYRNTFIGFVFQEYNVLNEFNVEENVALALELQGNMKGKDKVHQILEEVGLGNFAKRKPNTLSGGQKQRIAIARALVKDPQIIMADEPTGALDSGTGKQVFETLKKLSETRLVLVVSHDREFAEIYGDRIVELQDGKIISDVTKVKDAARQIDSNLSVIGKNTLAIKKGTHLDDEAIMRIRSFLDNSQSDIIISKGEKEVSGFKRINRIDDSGSQERFDTTDESQLDIKQYDGSSTKFIRSRLPAGKAIKIGAASLKLKPIRLMFTILLSLISFVMFGLFSTMMLYDNHKVLVNSFRDSDYEYVTLQKKYHTINTYYYDNNEPNSYDSENSTLFTPAELNSYGETAIGAYYTGGRVSNVDNEQSIYYIPYINYAAVLPLNHAFRQKITTGAYPKDETEILIGSYLAECLKEGNFFPIDKNGKTSSTPKNIENISELVGETILLNSRQFKISGIFDSGSIPAKYEELKNSSDVNMMTSYTFQQYISEGLHSLAFFDEDAISSLKSNDSEYKEYFDHGQVQLILPYPSKDDENNYYYGAPSVKVYDPNSTEQLPIILADNKSGALKDDELIVSSEFYFNYKRQELYLQQDLYSSSSEYENDPEYQALQSQCDEINDELNDLYNLESKIIELNGEIEWRENMQNEDPNIDYSEELAELRNKLEEAEDMLANRDDRITELAQQREKLFNQMNEIKYKFQNEIDKLYTAENNLRNMTIYDPELETEREPTQAERDEAMKTLKELVKEPITITLYKKSDFSSNDAGTPVGEYKVVGCFYSNDSNYYYQGYYCSQSVYDMANVTYRNTVETKYVKEADATYSVILVPLSKDESSLTKFFANINVINDNDVKYTLDNSLYESVDMVNGMMESISTVFLIIGIVLAVLSALLLFNFITMSISNKRKEIGILRAVGAKGTDVFKIFFAESGIIVGICLVLALIGTVIGTSLLNNIIRNNAGLEMTLFNFGPLSVIIMVAIALVVAFVATFLPVYFAARKKPVESIRAL